MKGCPKIFWNFEIIANSVVYRTTQLCFDLRTKIQGVIRYCEARPQLMRTGVIMDFPSDSKKYLTGLPFRMSKYGEGQMYWTEVRYRGSLQNLGA